MGSVRAVGNGESHDKAPRASDPWRNGKAFLVQVWLLIVCAENAHHSSLDVYSMKTAPLQRLLPRLAKPESSIQL